MRSSGPCRAWPRSPSAAARRGLSSCGMPPRSGCARRGSTGPPSPCRSTADAAAAMRPCGRAGTPMAVLCGASVTDCSGWPASFSDGGCCSIPTMVRPPLHRLQRSRRLTLSVPQPALQQSAARKCCPGGRERPRRQAPARSVLDDTSTALRSMSEDNARHVECLTAGRKSTLACDRSDKRDFRSEERLKARLCTPEDQRVNVVGALVGVDGFQVLRVAHDVVFLLDAVAAVHVAGNARNVERLTAVVAFDERDHLGRGPALVEEASDPEAG